MSMRSLAGQNLVALESEVRDRLEPMPKNGLKDATLVCIDARAGHPECKVLGADHTKHVVRHAGALHGAETDLNVAWAMADPRGFEKTSHATHEIDEELAEALGQLGLFPIVHEECTDLHATPETAKAMARFDNGFFETARTVLRDDLDHGRYARVVQGSGLVVASNRIAHPTDVMKRLKTRKRIPIAKLRNSSEPRLAVVANHTDQLLPPMEYDKNGRPKHSLVFDADLATTIPKLTEAAQGILSPKIKQHHVEAVAATHLAVLRKKLGLPLIVID